MAHIWYEGNLNKEEAKREHAGIIYYDRGPILVQDKAYERYGLKTHFITQGEDYLTLMKDYVLPLYQDKDVLSNQISAMIVDANDIAAEILGCSQNLKGREEELAKLIADNPAGQDDELTPFILIRPAQEGENSKEKLAHFA